MSEPFLAEIKIVGFNFAPRGYAFCDGQLLPIAQNQSLYSLLGTTYGGDGRTTFALPDLRGRVPMHFGPAPAPTLGQQGGQEAHLLTPAELPGHTHGAQATTTTPASTVQGGALLAPGASGDRRSVTPYGPPQNLTPLAAGSVSGGGAGEAHENMQPFTVLNFCIALQGLFPSRS
jgi:microcystin-dependent protein